MMNRRFTMTLISAVVAFAAWSDGAIGQPRDRDAATRSPAGRADHKRAEREVRRAVAVLVPVGDSGVSGIVYFTQAGERVQVRGLVRGLEPGKHGFHVHEYGDLSDLKKGESAGDHYNPTGDPHGRRTERKRHVGDLGNIEANEHGEARFDFTDSVIQLNGPHSILGRAVVVHGDEDKFTQPSGDAGDRVAFGIIGIAQPEKAERKESGS